MRSSKKQWGAASGYRLKDGSFAYSIYVFKSKRDRGDLQQFLIDNPNIALFTESKTPMLKFFKKHNIKYAFIPKHPYETEYNLARKLLGNRVNEFDQHYIHKIDEGIWILQ